VSSLAVVVGVIAVTLLARHAWRSLHGATRAVPELTADEQSGHRALTWLATCFVAATVLAGTVLDIVPPR
jgi:hypothetical protein